MNDLAGALKVVADESRLRVLRLLLLAPELNASEIQAVLGLSQPSVSRLLGDLKRAGVVRERRDGGFVFYELQRSSGPTSGQTPASRLVDLMEPTLREEHDVDGDGARLAEVLRDRADRGAGAGDRLLEPGRSWVAWARALGFLVGPLRVVDLGCGDGALTIEIAGFAKSLIAVERDAARLARARERLIRRGYNQTIFKNCDAADTGIRAGSQDLVVLSQLLHHVEQPSTVLAEAHRILARGGRALVLELQPHEEHWVQEKLGHVHLGFAPKALTRLLLEAGFSGIVVDPVAGRGVAEPFRVVVASGVKK